MTGKQKRFVSIGFVAVVLTTAVGLVLTALRDRIVFFYVPSEIVLEKKALPGQRFRLGGLVKQKSVRTQDTVVSFIITDANMDIEVKYSGILPGLFREGQGVVAEGKLDRSFVFMADSILAKHDETYIPKEVADSLKKQGYWKKQKTSGKQGKTP